MAFHFYSDILSCQDCLHSSAIPTQHWAPSWHPSGHKPRLTRSSSKGVVPMSSLSAKHRFQSVTVPLSSSEWRCLCLLLVIFLPKGHSTYSGNEVLQHSILIATGQNSTRRRWNDNIKMHLGEIVDCIQLAHGELRWRAFMNWWSVELHKSSGSLDLLSTVTCSTRSCFKSIGHTDCEPHCMWDPVCSNSVLKRTIRNFSHETCKASVRYVSHPASTL
jgi:hypothetical protein